MGETLSLPEVPSSVLQFESRVLFVQTVFSVQFTPKRDAINRKKSMQNIMSNYSYWMAVNRF